MLKGIGALLQQVVQLTISADTNDYNLRAAFDAGGNPAIASIVICTINSGVIVGTASVPHAFRTGGFPAGSVLRLINNGKIWGGGGSGGQGGSSATIGQHTPGAAGGDGSDAIYLDYDLTIDNTNGYILGGSGGGGGGSSDWTFGSFGGGGGGGGAGRPNGAGGAGGTGFHGNGTVGGTGNAESGYGGGGGSGAGTGRDGGAGGTWSDGEAGGSNGYPPSDFGAGGAQGKAVALNGHAVDWVAGNNTSQVKGAVA